MTNPAFAQIYWNDVEAGSTLPVVAMEVTYKICILHVGAGWDYMPGHHNPDYARAQGQPTVFVNTLFHQSFVDRVVTDWAGPLTFINRRKIAMKGSICAGDHIEGHGVVKRVYRSDDGEGRIDFDIVVKNQTMDCCIAECTATLPQRPA